ncbi:Spectrin beta chain, non-erythrocytic 1 [Bagarius yarrelli]|uniref:Spectrin beta chain, non-erythrocytic 1 n=1 Tax=Bagarius yarrelli TaxID=175774 RepID=A0A556V9Y8_BAGYA|nr:Spectrin beta chain, non-erythrocytic 1 [Bagarius yarrelli]
MTTVAAEYDHIEIQQQYQDTVNNRWDEEWDNENSSARLFERSRIKALAGLSEEELSKGKVVGVCMLSRGGEATFEWPGREDRARTIRGDACFPPPLPSPPPPPSPL